jgi:gas vesicle protein
MARSNASNVWPYVLAGSAIGGAVGYLFMTESGRKVRHALANPDEVADNIDDVRILVERKARVITGRVRTALDRARQGMETGQRAFEEASQNYRSRMQRIQGKNDQIAETVHKNVDNLNRTASAVEESLLDPLYEAGALVRGIQRGIQAVLRGGYEREQQRTLRPASNR